MDTKRIENQLDVIIQLLMLSITTTVITAVPPVAAKGILDKVNEIYSKLTDRKV